MPLFLKPEDPLLTMAVPEVPVHLIGSKEIQSCIDTMYQISCGERTDGEKRVMVGLAAPQVGIPWNTWINMRAGKPYEGCHE